MAEATTSNQPVPPTGLSAELAAFWQRLPDKGIFFILLAAWLALFHFLGNSTFGYIDTPSLFQWMYHSYNAPLSDDGHGNLIPFVVLGLLWWKRGELLAVPKAPWTWGLGIVGAGLVLHVVGFAVQQPRISIVGFFTGLYGLTGLVWGPRWLRATFFPFFLFAFCVPLGSLAESITFPMRMLVAKISVAFSHIVLGVDVLRHGSQIYDAHGHYSYEIAPACSGIRSLISLLALTTIYGFVTFRATWRRLLMIGLAFPLAILGNVIRIVAVIIAAETFGQTAGSRVHDGAGFVTFAIAVVCLMAISYLVREEKLS